MSEHKFSVLPGRAVKDRRITDSIYRTLSALCMYADKDGWCFPSQSTLAEDIGKTRKTVNEHLQLLEEWGYVRSEHRKKEDGSPTSKMYQVIYDQITWPMSTPDYSDPEYSGGYTNDSSNDPINNMASGENRPLPYDWQIAAGVKEIRAVDETDAKIRDAADLIATGMGSKSLPAYDIAYAFMKTRGIIIPVSKAKQQRKAVKEMLEMGVMPGHVIEATQKLMEAKMTVTDLYSVSKTAIDLANPAPEDNEYHGPVEGV